MKCICTLWVFLSFLFCCTLSGLGNENQPRETDVPSYLIKANDQVFFRITECDLKSVDKSKISDLYFSVWEFKGTQTPAEILESEATSSSDNKVKFDNPLIEFLLKNNAKAKYRILVKNKQWGNDPTLATIGISDASEILDGINKKIAENPDDHEKWTVTLTDKETQNQVTLAFAGVTRVYQLKSIKVPSSSAHTQHKQYQNGHAPMFRVYIDKNGKNVGQIEVKEASWEIDYPASDKNRWVIREGMGDTYLIRLRDCNTTVREHPIMQISGLAAEDFAKGDIFEKLEKLDNQSRAVRFIFEPVK
jgi:hypothetical protein